MSDNRYIRQTALPGFGDENQAKLRTSSILIIGMGGLGCPVAQYVNSMGVGTLGLLDFDQVQESNLHRQTLYSESDCGKSKVDVAKKVLSKQNSATHIIAHHEVLSKSNALEIIDDYTLIVDCTDNIASRYLINDACLVLNKPFVSGSLFRNSGQIAVFNHEGSGSYRCLYPDANENIINCNEAGVLGVLPGIIGTRMALEAVKVVTSYGTGLGSSVLIIDAFKNTEQKLKFNRDNANFTRTSLDEVYDTPNCMTEYEIDFSDYCQLPNRTEIKVIDVRDASEFNLGHINKAINIPLDKIETEITRLQDDTAFLFVCKSGKRSLSALNIALALGYTNSLSLSGGMDALQKENAAIN